MKQLSVKPYVQRDLFPASSDPPVSRSISVYRVSLVKDESVSFGNVRLANSQEAQALIQNLILTKGQPDREQFVVTLLNSKNEIIGLNIVSVGGLSSAPVHPREVLKPAILANAAAMVLAHNHPSNDLEPSPDDINVTKKIIRAAEIVGIQVHEHLIISMEDDRYYSFADQGIIARMYADLA
ncbi:DNA repair protein RadC [Desulfosarcina widdelii]|uniref:DNA repair protein RadC n=1 Tax=Desulfosarcina widdelii TaxID=947919 RepID=A0A5K7Z3K2_9BACT|nr:JAB domain-containing protein [Desulfosarcina widdelii]BBO74553.1 DNA repair protein RadC [Desulfosarcina widdelii]